MKDDAAKGCPVAAGAEGYDPFEEFNRAQGIGKVENPVPRVQGQARPLPRAHGRPGVPHGRAGEAHASRCEGDLRGAEPRRRGAGAARRRDLHVDDLRQQHGPGDGPHHPRDGRARALEIPAPDPAGVQQEGARPLGDGSGAADRERLHRPLRGPRPRRSRARAHLPVPGQRDRRHARASRGRPPGVPPARRRADQHRHRSDARDPGLAGARALLPAADRRAPRRAARRPDQRARHRRAGGHAPDRRRDRGLPAPAAAGRSRDDLPLLEQPDLRPAHATPTSSTRCAGIAR